MSMKNERLARLKTEVAWALLDRQHCNELPSCNYTDVVRLGPSSDRMGALDVRTWPKPSGCRTPQGGALSTGVSKSQQ